MQLVINLEDLVKTTLLSAIAITVLAAAGCKKDKTQETDDKGPTAGKTNQQEKPTPEPKKWTAADTMKRVDECIGYWNSGDMSKLAGCYGDSGTLEFVNHVPPMEHTGDKAIAEALEKYRSAFPDSKTEPQLVLVNGNNYAIIGLNTGTNTGEMEGMPATDKKTSTLSAILGVVDDQGTITNESHVYDQTTTMAQLGIGASPMAPESEKAWPDTVRVTAESSETEAANVQIVNKVQEAIGNKDTETLAGVLADDARFRYVPNKDVSEGKDAVIQSVQQFLGMFDPLEMTIKESWPAGDWVVVVLDVKGALAGDLPGAKGTKGKEFNTNRVNFIQLADGKVKQVWVFENSLSMLAQIGAFDPGQMGGGGKTE